MRQSVGCFSTRRLLARKSTLHAPNRAQETHLRHPVADGREQIGAVQQDVAAAIRRAQQVGKLEVHRSKQRWRAAECGTHTPRRHASRLARCARPRVRVCASPGWIG